MCVWVSPFSSPPKREVSREHQRSICVSWSPKTDQRQVLGSRGTSKPHQDNQETLNSRICQSWCSFIDHGDLSEIESLLSGKRLAGTPGREEEVGGGGRGRGWGGRGVEFKLFIEVDLLEWLEHSMAVRISC